MYVSGPGELWRTRTIPSQVFRVEVGRILPKRLSSTSGARLLLKVVTWSVTPMQLRGSVLMSVAPVATKVPVDTWSLGHYLWSSWYLRDVTPRGPWQSRIPALLPRTMGASGLDCCEGPCLGLWLCWAGLIVDVHSFCWPWKPCRGLNYRPTCEAMLILEG